MYKDFFYSVLYNYLCTSYLKNDEKNRITVIAIRHPYGM